MYSTPPENHEANRLTVADILSTMASVDAMTPTTVSSISYLYYTFMMTHCKTLIFTAVSA